MVKVLHCADLHLDGAFAGVSVERSDLRRAELRETFSSMLDYVRSEKIDIVLMSGDIFDTPYVSKDTMAFFKRSLASVPECRFVIAAGNHDPYSKDGIYDGSDYSSNVYIFKESTLGKFSFPELSTEVYGYAFVGSSLESSPLASSAETAEASDLLKLLCAHGDIGNPLSSYCPISESDIARSGFDYCGFGHIHLSGGVKKAGNTLYAYSGCLEGRDFGETGYKGAILIEADKANGQAEIRTEQIRFSKRRYEIISVDISGASDGASVLGAVTEAIKNGGYGDDTLLRVILTGSVSPSLTVDKTAIENAAGQGLCYIEVADKALPLYDTEVLYNDPTVRGELFRILRPKLENGSPEERATAARALRIGLCALAGEDFSGIV